MSKQERVVHKTSLRPYLDKLVRAKAGDGSISAVISEAVNYFFNNDYGLSQDYLSKLHEFSRKEKREVDDMVRIIIEEHLDRVKYVKIFK